jgi:hypothetical protein
VHSTEEHGHKYVVDPIVRQRLGENGQSSQECRMNPPVVPVVSPARDRVLALKQAARELADEFRL